DVWLHLRKRLGSHLAVDGLENGFAIVRTEIFDDVRQIRGMHALKDLVANVEAQPPLRIGFDNAAMLPADGMRRNQHLYPANQAGWNHALGQTPQYAAQPDIDVQDIDHLSFGFVVDFKRYIGDAHHFTTLPVDDLLVEQIADQPQHVFVGMIRREQLVFEIDTIQRDG